MAKNYDGKTPANLYIRWLGAFRNKGRFTLEQSLKFEWDCEVERACERLNKHNAPQSAIKARVGLMFSPKDVIKSFERDCWSLLDNEGVLHPTRSGKYGKSWSSHTEAWLQKGAKPIAVICEVKKFKLRPQDEEEEPWEAPLWGEKKDPRYTTWNGWYSIKGDVRKQILSFVQEHPELSVYNLYGRHLEEVVKIAK